MTSPRPHRWDAPNRLGCRRLDYVLLVSACVILSASSAFGQLGAAVAANDVSGGDPPGEVPRVDLGLVEDPQISPGGSPADIAESSPPALTDVELSEEALDAKLDRLGSIALRDASLSDWLFAIRKEWGINIVYSADQMKNDIVLGEFENATLREILDAILLTRGYGYQRIRNTLMILPEEKMGPMKPQFEDEIIKMEFNNPKDVAESVRVLLSPGGVVNPMPVAKSIYVADLPARLQKVRKHVQMLEANARDVAEQERQRQEMLASAAGEGGRDPGTSPDSMVEIDQEAVNIYPLRFVRANDLLETVQGILGAEGRISVLTEENKLVVIAPSSALHGVSEVVRRLDVPRPQVKITALLYDVDTEEIERLGFNWSDVARARINASGDPQSLFSLDSTNFSEVAGAMSSDTGDDLGDASASVVTLPPGGLLQMQYFSRYFDWRTVIQAFSQLEGARLLARPTVIAYDGVQATFRSVSEIPVQQLTQTSEGGAIGTTEFREAGITLTVTPTINDDGSLRLQISPEFSVLAGFQSGQPIIDRRSANTMVHLYDGEAVVIGGLLRRNELETQTGVPGLKKLKYLSPLFRYHDTTVAESELLVFVKAEIIGPRPEMEPRNQMAQAILTEAVEGIPVAAPHPMIPHCGDPYCPLHSPAPRWLGPGMVIEDHPVQNYSEELHGDPHSQPLPHPTDAPPPPVYDPDSDTGAAHQPTPAMGPRHVSQRRGLRLPGFQVEPAASAHRDTAFHQPPTAERNVIRRLPHISNETDASHLAPASAPYLPPAATRPNQAAGEPPQRRTFLPAGRRWSPRPPAESAAAAGPHAREQQPAPPAASPQRRSGSDFLRRFIRFE